MENSSAIYNAVPEVSFSWYDYIFFSLMLVLSAAIGIYFGCFGTKQATADEYLMGNKKMKVIPIAVSLIASHVSGITLLSVPADIYRFGAGYFNMVLTTISVTIITIYVYLPVFYKLRITSTYEYLEKRFDNRTRMFASFIFAFGLFLYLPIVTYIPALALSAATKINVHYISPVVCGVCIFYTTLGGLKAVVWTDTLQFAISTGAVVVVFILGLQSAGGFETVWVKSMEGHRLDVFDFDPDPTKRDTFWIVFIGFGTYWLSMVSTNQSCVQKYLSVPTLRQAKLSIILFSVGVIAISSISIFTGLIMYSKYANCDPFTNGAIKNNDQILLYYVMDVAAHLPGLPGVFIAGIFCSALSTLSACLNCVAGTIYEDFILKFTTVTFAKRTSSYILKLIVVVVGLICTALIFVFERLGGILPLVIGFTGVTGGPLLGLFSLGLLFPKASRKGAFYGSVIGLICSLSINVTAHYYKSQGLIVYESKPISVEGCGLNNLTTIAPNNLSISDKNNTTEILVNVNSITSRKMNDDVEEQINEPFFLFRISYYYYSTLGCVVTLLVGLIISYCLQNDDPPVHPDLISPVIHFLLKPTEK